MSKLVTDILADVQNEIGDLSGEMISEGELLSMFDDVNALIGMETRMHLARYTAPTIAGSNNIEIPEIDPNTGQILNPFRIHRVVLLDPSQRETREFSLQAVSKTSDNFHSFPNVDLALGANNFGVWINNDSRMLTFGIVFDGTENIVIDFIQTKRFVMNFWRNNTISVPDYTIMAYKYGMQHRVLLRLYNQGKLDNVNNVQMAKQNFREELHKIAYHSRYIKDDQTAAVLLPVNWLPE